MSSGPTRSVDRLSLVALTLLVMIVVLSLSSLRGQPPLPITGQEERTPTVFVTSTPGYPRPIFSATDAISRSLELFPAGFTPQQAVARNISHRTLNEWRDGPDYWQENPWVPGEYHPDHPVWIVGILADGLDSRDVMSLGIPEMFMSPTPKAVPGAYYSWDANSGFEAGFGTLITATGEDFASIVNLPTEEITVVPATEIPAIGEPTPTP